MNKFNYILDKVPSLKDCDVLDIFAREGDWQSFNMNGKVKSLEAWEINNKFIPKLKDNLPFAKVVCRDSISFINSKPNYKKFDLIVIDNGLNCYGNGYCEHFDFLENVRYFLKPSSFIIFNVVLHPFNYESNKKWQNRRNKFYGISDCSNLSSLFFKNYYTTYFENLGFNVNEYYTICREYYNDIDYLYYVGMKLES